MALKQPQPTLEELAGTILNHLAHNPDELADFMSISGLSVDALRGAAGTRSFAVGLLDYVVQNEPLLLAVCGANAMSPDAVMRVWAKHNQTE